MDLFAYHAFIEELARESAAVILPHYGRPELSVEIKADDSPVTVADRAAEQRLRELINAKFPAHGIIGEEFGSENADAEWTWVLDPIDGTKSFITGVPMWGTLIALLHRGQPMLGCIHQPALGQLMIGDSRVTTLNGRPVRARATTQLERATVLTSDTRNLAKYQDGAACERLVAQAGIYRTWGDCYGYLLLAAGFADVCLDPIMNPWDIAALVPVIRGAGGVISDWRGGPAYPADSTVAAATPELHARAIEMLNSKTG